MRTRRVAAMAVGTLATLATPLGAGAAQASAGAGSSASPHATGAAGAPAAAAAQDAAEPATELIIDSRAGEFVGQGFIGVLQPPVNAVSASSSTNGAKVEFSGDTGSGWSFNGVLTAPPGEVLKAGTTYPAGAAGIAISAADRVCGSVNGTFTVEQIAFDNGALSQFEAVFTQYCGKYMTSTPSGPPITGLIRYNATGPAPEGAPTAKPMAAPSGTVGPLTFRRGQQLMTAQAGAQTGTVIATLPAVPDATLGRTAWSPLGTRQLFTQEDGLVSVNPDGSSPREVTTRQGQVEHAGDDEEPAVSPDGGVVVFVREGTSLTGGSTPGSVLMTAYTDGSRDARLLDVQNRCTAEHTPSFAPDGSLIYQCNAYDSPSRDDTYHFVNGASTLLIADATHAVYSPDGTKIAFVRADESGLSQVFTVDADGAGDLTQVTHDETGAANPAWSPDGRYLAYVEPAFQAIIEVPAGGGAPVGRLLNAGDPSWEPTVAAGHVQREWGSDRLATAIAASQADFAAHGDTADHRSQAGAVVLARSDNFADALGGSALAVQRDAPLLTTPTAGLDPAVQAEISRVLAPGGTVYLLGGTGALSPAVAQALTGYTVIRLAGGDRYATAASIAHVVNPKPSRVFIATGDNYPDALSAGAIGLPVLLTHGAVMPAATASYLNGLNPDYTSSGGTQLVTIGGPGNNALHSAVSQGQMPAWGAGQINWFVIAGNTRYATSLGVAETFFVANTDVALATGMAWPDALSGGAMIGHRASPLLLVDPNGINADTMAYLHGQASSLATLHLIGGAGALPPAIATQAAQAFEDPAHVRYGEVTPGSPLPFATRAHGTADATTARPDGPAVVEGLAAADATEARARPMTARKES